MAMPVLLNTGRSLVNSTVLPPSSTSIRLATSSCERMNGGVAVAVDRIRADFDMNALSQNCRDQHRLKVGSRTRALELTPWLNWCIFMAEAVGLAANDGLDPFHRVNAL